MLHLVLAVAFLTTAAWGGSQCPPRKEIYPCSCANIRIHRRSSITIVNCYGLDDKEALNSIFPALRSMEIDRFYLYDSFWKAHLRGASAESQKVLPADWITMLKIKEIEIVDTTLSSCFACDWKINCKNTVTTSFKVTNSSSSDRICSLCDAGRGNKSPWTGCMSNLKEFHFNYGKLNSFGLDFFPVAMRELITLNLSYNQIVKIDSNVLKNIPKLQTLDLSHNAIEFFDHMFTSQETLLEHLDVSWNLIKTIGPDLFSSVPRLKIFKADNNGITELKRSDWAKIPDKLKNIDFSENPIHCDCNIRWINSTFHVSIMFQATCSTPDDYEGSPVRRASRLLLDRCDAGGRIGTRKPTSKGSKRRRG